MLNLNSRSFNFGHWSERIMLFERKLWPGLQTYGLGQAQSQ